MKEAKDMKEGWEYKKLGEVADFYRGLTYGKQDEAISSDVCVLRSNNIDMESMSLNFDEIKYLSPDFVIPEDKKLKGNSIFICMSNGSKQHVGKVAFVENDMDYAFGGFMGLITPSKEVSAKYVYYACRSPLYRVFLTSIGNGIGITNLKFTDLYNFSFPMPKLSHQQQIVSELDLLSGVIEKQKAQLAELDKLAQSIFYDMFGDPVTNEKGWEVKKIKDICKVITGNTPSRNNLEYYNEEYIEWIKTDNILRDSLYPSLAKEYLSEEGAKQGRIADVGSILIACIAGSLESISKCCLLNRKVSFNQQINALVPKEDMNSLFVYSLVNAIADYIRENTTNGMKHIITKSVLEEIRICVPPLSLQQDFAAKVEAIEAMKAKVRQSLKEAETLFNERMDYYFN